MPYVSKDDVLLYIDAPLDFSQGTAQDVQLVVFKDYINNQLNLSTADSITVTLFDSIGRKTYQYSHPQSIGTTSPLVIGTTAEGTHGYLNFTITESQSSTILTGDLFVEVALTFTNYYPTAKTYILPRLAIASLSAGNGTGGTGLGDYSMAVINPEAYTWYESSRFRLQTNVALNGQIEVAYYGYGALATKVGAGANWFNKS